MPLKISRIIQALEPSATLAMAAKAKELKAAGRTVYDLSVGEPDFTTPEHICQAAVAAMKAGHTHYTVASGIPELKKAVADQYKSVHGLQYAPAQVVIANGAKHAIHNVFTVVLEPRRRSDHSSPVLGQLRRTGEAHRGRARDRRNSAGKQFQAHARACFARPSLKNTKVLLLCSPSNPTGSMYSPDELGALADVAIEKNLLVIADEIYERLIYGRHKFASFATVRPGLQERTILINGVSKTYAMTGWRIGWSIVAVERVEGHCRPAEPGNVQSVQHQPIRRLDRHHRPARLRGDNAGRICQAARFRPRSDRENSRC